MSVTTNRSLLAEGNQAAISALRAALGEKAVSTREIDRIALAVDASHFLHTPDAIMRAKSPADVGVAMRIARDMGWPLTFRSGGSSLSGQTQSLGLTVDVRRHFRGYEVLDDGARIRLQPGLTVGQVNSILARYGRKLGPDPASTVAATVGGIINNNSSGMTCGVTANTYKTIDSLTIVLPSGTVVDTASPDADDLLRNEEPELVEMMMRLHETLSGDKYRADIERRYAIKNTMGYGINSFIDFDTPAKILEHLMVGSEGTLGFIAEAVFNTVAVPKRTATGLLVFDSIDAATEALPEIVYSGAGVVELMDAESIRAMGTDAELVLPPGFDVDQHSALLVEYQAMDDDGIRERRERGLEAIERMAGLSAEATLTDDRGLRAQMWAVRSGLMAQVMGNRPKGTMALLEDIAVPMERLGVVCNELQELFIRHDYGGSVIFGHAKDGNIHFMLTEDFAGPASLKRHDEFNEDLVELVLREQGSLKAEHGTGRVMAPFVERQYGPDLYRFMVEIKDTFDPQRVLNPGAIITDDPRQHLKNIKPTEPVRGVIDRCVECGYCEPVCPSQHLTTTPRQRIVIQRAIAASEESGRSDLAATLREQEVYDVTQTCAVDGMCVTACPVRINTGDLVREKRAETTNAALARGWKLAAEHWGTTVQAASFGLSVAKALPNPVVRGAAGVARKVTGDEVIPTISKEMHAGGKARKPAPKADPDAIFMPACLGTMFGSSGGCGTGVAAAVRELAEYAGLTLSTPKGIAELCCGTPWKSKGLDDGHSVMVEKLARWVVDATRDGELPLVTDNASCTEGVMDSLRRAGVEGVRVLDAVDWVASHVAPLLPPLAKARRAVVHPTCSSTQTGTNDALLVLAGLVADEAIVPDGWRCCGFAGDRGLLHEELTATATKDEARSVSVLEADLYVSLNRTCELGMTRATGKEYVHVLEVLAARLRDRVGAR